LAVRVFENSASTQRGAHGAEVICIHAANVGYRQSASAEAATGAATTHRSERPRDRAPADLRPRGRYGPIAFGLRAWETGSQKRAHRRAFGFPCSREVDGQVADHG